MLVFSHLQLRTSILSVEFHHITKWTTNQKIRPYDKNNHQYLSNTQIRSTGGLVVAENEGALLETINLICAEEVNANSFLSEQPVKLINVVFVFAILMLYEFPSGIFVLQMLVTVYFIKLVKYVKCMCRVRIIHSAVSKNKCSSRTHMR